MLRELLFFNQQKQTQINISSNKTQHIGIQRIGENVEELRKGRIRSTT